MILVLKDSYRSLEIKLRKSIFFLIAIWFIASYNRSSIDRNTAIFSTFPHERLGSFGSGENKYWVKEILVDFDGAIRDSYSSFSVER